MEMPPTDGSTIYRVLDANLNRATEALRVIEEMARFDLSDSHLARQLKLQRHHLTQLFQPLQANFLIARDTRSDVGTAITTESENTRLNLASVAAANFDRLGQSLRSLEEFSKPLHPELGPPLEQIRYQTYSVEKAINGCWRSARMLQNKTLYAITQGDADVSQFSRRVSQFIEIGVDIIQLRDQRLSDRELLLRSRTLADLTRNTEVLSVINDRADIALAAAADGVHVGQEDLPVAAVRRLAGDRLLIGVSTHSIEQARTAELDGADYIGVGPTFASTTKSFHEFPGTQLLKDVVAEIALPSFAIGGIGPHNLAQVLATGVQRVAVQAALHDSDAAAANAATIKAALRPQPTPSP